MSQKCSRCSPAGLKLLPTGFPYWRRGSCVPATYLILLQLPDAIPIQGYVSVYGAPYEEHSWVEHRGVTLDPTIRQFSWWRKKVIVQRLPTMRNSRQEFISQFERVIRMPWTDQGAAYQRFRKWINV